MTNIYDLAKMFPSGKFLKFAGAVVAIAALGLFAIPARAHIVAPENLHPAVESYRRAMFLLNLNPVPWDSVKTDAEGIAVELEKSSKPRAAEYRKAVAAIVDEYCAAPKEGEDPPGPTERKEAARKVFDLSTRAMGEMLAAELDELKALATKGDREAATHCLDLSRQYWAAFEYEIKATDTPMFQTIGQCWLTMATALGNAALLGQGEIPIDAAVMARESDEILDYLKLCYMQYETPAGRLFSPVPLASKSFDAKASIAAKLPPGTNINKQRPRPRQVLNMVERGVDETETPLIAFGDMAFDSPQIFGEPARSLGISCATCHNKSITNPQFTIPGISSHAGGLDVSSNFFAPHANNGLFDPLDIPDLRGIRFTAPYGRNGRFASLRDFTRNVIVNEFNGPEPDPIVVDSMLAYMLEFDFLPNPMLNANGTLNAKAPDAARRGEALFNKPFEKMGGMSCASCHVPSSNFVDGKRHDIGSIQGAAPDSLDRGMDTPTLLSAKYSQPYMHDGSLATLGDVVAWFDKNYQLGLSATEASELTAYLEAVGEGTEAYESDPDVASPAEVEEQYFFMASYEFIRDKGKTDLLDTLFRTVAVELRNEKWGLKYAEATECVEKLAQLADAAGAANKAGKVADADALVLEYRKLYEANKAMIDGEKPPQPVATAAGNAYAAAR